MRERSGKREACARLGLDLFIGDLAKNLESLRGVVPHLIQFGEESRDFDFVPDWRSADALVRRIAG